jgi:ankyrin repeat protein
MEACYHGQEAVARLLLERGADVTLRSRGGHTALSLAATDAITALLRAQGATA